jgi:hypothetical protein
MRKLKKKALAYRYFKNGRHTVLTRVVIIGISRVGRGLGVLSRLLGRIRVGVGGLVLTGMIIWVLVLAAHDGVRRGTGKYYRVILR